MSLKVPSSGQDKHRNHMRLRIHLSDEKNFLIAQQQKQFVYKKKTNYTFIAQA